MAITRLWFFTLRPSVSATDPAFTKLWSELLELCATYTPQPGPSSSQIRLARLSTSCPKRPHHFLLQTVSSSSSSLSSPSAAAAQVGQEGREARPVYILISSYPSFALCTQADAVYRQRFRDRMFELVEHRALRQMDMEDAEVVAALLSSPPKGSSSVVPLPNVGDGEGGGDVGRGGGEGQGERPTVTVTISSRDPLKSEVAEALSSPERRASAVPPPDEEISGADTYELPSAPVVLGGAKDFFAKQRSEGKRFIRISRRVGDRDRVGDGDAEVYRLKEIMSR